MNLWLTANAGPRGGCGDPSDPCVDNAAGLANLLYPPLGGDSMVPISSLRWDMLRKGLEDAEYFHRLDALADSLVERGGCDALPEASTECDAARRARGALDRVSEVVWAFPDSKNLSSAPYSSDSRLMHDVLDEVGAAIRQAQAALAVH